MGKWCRSVGRSRQMNSSYLVRYIACLLTRARKHRRGPGRAGRQRSCRSPRTFRRRGTEFSPGRRSAGTRSPGPSSPASYLARRDVVATAHTHTTRGRGGQSRDEQCCRVAFTSMCCWRMFKVACFSHRNLFVHYRECYYKSSFAVLSSILKPQLKDKTLRLTHSCCVEQTKKRKLCVLFVSRPGSIFYSPPTPNPTSTRHTQRKTRFGDSADNTPPTKTQARDCT